MTTQKKRFSGIYPYLVTPLDQNGHLKEEVLVHLIEHLIHKGVHGITVLGSTGEGAYLDGHTKLQVVKVAVEAINGRVPLIAGVNNLTTHGAVHEASLTERAGVDGILVVLPTYFPITDKQVVHHFRTVSKAVSCPVTLYTNPKFAQWDFTIDTLTKLLEVENILYLKDASGDMAKLMAIFTSLGDKIKIFSASAHVPLFVFMLGGVGWMAGPACLIPELSVALYEMALQKRWHEALEMQKKLWPLNMAFQKYSLAACVKSGLEMQGFAVGPPLSPQRQLDAEGLNVVRSILEQMNAL